jgi:GST-like protein
MDNTQRLQNSNNARRSRNGIQSPHDRHRQGDTKGKYLVSEWLFFQMASVGPMMGQLFHFKAHAPEKIDYAVDRYTTEVMRILMVLEGRLSESAYLAGDEYTIADISTWTWVRMAPKMDIDLETYPAVAKWIETIEARPAVKKALEKTDAAKEAKA